MVRHCHWYTCTGTNTHTRIDNDLSEWMRANSAQNKRYQIHDCFYGVNKHKSQHKHNSYMEIVVSALCAIQAHCWLNLVMEHLHHWIKNTDTAYCRTTQAFVNNSCYRFIEMLCYPIIQLLPMPESTIYTQTLSDSSAHQADFNKSQQLRSHIKYNYLHLQQRLILSHIGINIFIRERIALKNWKQLKTSVKCFALLRLSNT